MTSTSRRRLPPVLGPQLAIPALFALVAACSDKTTPAAQVAAAPPPETIYVQQPPLPPPPPVPLRVEPRNIAFDAIGDTVRLTMPEGSTCLAASESVARVDAAGLITAAGNGETHLRCWLDDHNALVRIHVTQQLARVAVVSEEGLSLRAPGDSVRLTLARVDRRGTPVEGPRPLWTSLAPTVIRVDPVTGTAIGVADTGTARIVGQTDGLADTVIMEVGAKQQSLLSSTSRLGSRSRIAARSNQRLTNRGSTPAAVQTQATNGAGRLAQGQNPLGINARAAQPSDSLFVDPQYGTAGARPRMILPYFIGGFAEHRIDVPVSAGGLGLEKTSGAVFGGGLELHTGGALSFRLNFLTGKLTADSANVTVDRTYLDGSADVGLTIAPWLTITAGGQSRRYETPVATERWLMLRAGGEAAFNLGGGPLRGIARIFILPLVSLASSVSTPTAPSFGMQSELGFGFENRRISSSLTYDIERYSFPSSTQRREQFGALLFRFGYKFGW